MHARIRLLAAYLWALATLRSSSFGVSAMLRPPPKLYLYSCGWADALDNKETISSGLVFDVCNVGTDHEEGGPRGSRQEAPRWRVFGGEGAEVDHELASTKELKDLLELLQSFCARYLDCLPSTPSVPALIVSLICKFGKHRSRWLVVN